MFKIYRANTSPLSTHPMMFPRWGTLLTYGKALVIKMFLSPGSGRLEWVREFVKFKKLKVDTHSVILCCHSVILCCHIITKIIS